MADEAPALEPQKRALVLILACFGALLAVEAFCALVLPKEWLDAHRAIFFSERGVFEIATNVLYVVACFVVWRFLDAAVAVRLAIIYLCLLLFARELDFDSRFTEISAMRTKFLFESQYPAGQRIIAGTVLGLGVACALFLTARAGLPYLRALRQGSAAAWLGVIGFVFLPISKGLDGGAQDIRRLFHFTRLPQPLGVMSYQFEETLEMLAPICVILAVFLWRRESGAVRGAST